MEASAEELEDVLCEIGQGHPLAFGLDVKWRARKVARHIECMTELAAGFALEAVKLNLEYRTQFAELVSPKPVKRHIRDHTAGRFKTSGLRLPRPWTSSNVAGEMPNDRLRAALLERGVTIAELAAVQVDPKTVERWITKGRAPYRRHRYAVATTSALRRPRTSELAP